MKRSLLIAALCSSCTFAHGFAHRHDPKPDATVQLSPAMKKLDDEQKPMHWQPVADMGAAFVGFGAHDFMKAIGEPNETVNLIGLGVFAIGGLSMIVGEALWGE